jgi:hypothetical protein
METQREIFRRIVPMATKCGGEDREDQRYTEFVEVCLRQVPNLTLSAKKTVGGNTVYEGTSDGMHVNVIAGRNTSKLSAITGPILLLT